MNQYDDFKSLLHCYQVFFIPFFSKTASFIKMLINDSIIFVLNFTGVSYCIRDTFWKIHLIHIDGQWQVNNIYMSAWGLNFVILYYDTSPVCYVCYMHQIVFCWWKLKINVSPFILLISSPNIQDYVLTLPKAMWAFAITWHLSSVNISHFNLLL